MLIDAAAELAETDFHNTNPRAAIPADAVMANFHAATYSKVGIAESTTADPERLHWNQRYQHSIGTDDVCHIYYSEHQT